MKPVEIADATTRRLIDTTIEIATLQMSCCNIFIFIVFRIFINNKLLSDLSFNILSFRYI